MKLREFGNYLIKDLFFDRVRSILTTISLTAVIVSFLAASSLADVFQRYGNQPQSGSHELLILSDYALEPMQSKLDDSILQAAVEIVHNEYGPDSLRNAFPVLYRTLEVNNKTMQVLAIPRENLIKSPSLILKDGNWPETDEQVVVTQEGMQMNGWKIGESIPIRDNNLLISGSVKDNTGTSVIWMNYSAGQNLFNVQVDPESQTGQNIFQIGVLEINESLDLTAVQTNLEKDPSFPKGYAVYLDQQLYGRYTELVRDLLKVAYIISILALIVIIFGTFNAASLTMTERKQDIAILQTIGFGFGEIHLFLLGRILVQTMIAFLLAWGIVAIIIINSLKYPIIFFAKTAVLQLKPETVFLSFILTMLSASLGVWLTVQSQNRPSLADKLRD
jgi:hypothetical protein